MTGENHLIGNNVNAYHGRLKQWLNRFNGVATKNLPNYLGWRRALEAWGDQATPQTWIKGANRKQRPLSTANACLMTFHADEAKRNRWERAAALSTAARDGSEQR